MVKDIEEYLDKQSLEEVSSGHIFEAMCEVIVEKNEDYKLENLVEEYRASDVDDPSKFIEYKIDNVLSEEIKYVITISNYHSWIDSTLFGFRDYGVNI